MFSSLKAILESRLLMLLAPLCGHISHWRMMKAILLCENLETTTCLI
ncbi:hypothetical protein V6Z11_D03G103300 [Gossypium hirsutum]